MKKLLSMFLACVLLLGILPTSAWAADSVEAALGEVDIYNGGYELGYFGGSHRAVSGLSISMRDIPTYTKKSLLLCGIMRGGS